MTTPNSPQAAVPVDSTGPGVTGVGCTVIPRPAPGVGVRAVQYITATPPKSDRIDHARLARRTGREWTVGEESAAGSAPMHRPFSVIHLGAWVLLYTLCAVGPRWVVAELPDDYLNRPVRVGSPVTVREAAGWFPQTMAIAAGVTLAVGLAFGAMCGLLGAGGWLAARAAGADAAHPGSAWRALSPARIACGVVGILPIVGGVVGIWLSVAENQRMDRMDLIIAAIGGGIGVATGGAFHSRG